MSEYNLSYQGQMLILETLDFKMSKANYDLECSGRRRTIINIDDYEATVIAWALSDYRDKIKNRIKENEHGTLDEGDQ